MSHDLVLPFDRYRLRDQFHTARPFPFVCIDPFLDADFAREVAGAYPSFEQALQMGRSFSAVNEKRKVQVTDYEKFPGAVKRLADELSSQAFLDRLSYVTGIPKLVWDSELEGGGMHQTSSSGRLDVHVDFNYIRERDLHRRLNILVYLNPEWSESWGGNIELWDRNVRRCEHSFAPTFNRCVIFETSGLSYHGVTQVKPPPGVARRSFAAYYYTREPPPGWAGTEHTTIFRARPNEMMRGLVLMPAEKARHRALGLARAARRRVKALLPESTAED